MKRLNTRHQLRLFPYCNLISNTSRPKSRYYLCSSTCSCKPVQRFLLIGCFKPRDDGPAREITKCIKFANWVKIPFIHLLFSFEVKSLDLLFCSSCVSEGRVLFCFVIRRTPSGSVRVIFALHCSLFISTYILVTYFKYNNQATHVSFSWIPVRIWVWNHREHTV